MKKSLFWAIPIIAIIISGCAKDGEDGKSYISYGTDGYAEYFALLTGITYDYKIETDDTNWDGEWDFDLLSLDENATCKDVTQHEISPGTYNFTVTIIAKDNGSISGTVSSDTLIYCTSASECPDNGLVVNSPLVVTENNHGTASDGIEDGEPGLDNWYMFYVSYSGTVIWVGDVCP
jgi:hypothetical protein